MVNDLEEFRQYCLKGKCLRKTIKSKQCLKYYKQETCFKKYQVNEDKRKIELFEPDYKWLELKEELVFRDGSCLVMKILTPQEISIVEKLDGYWLNNKFVDGAHIKSRAELPKQIYNIKNVVLLGRFFHTRIDNYQDLITGENISKEQVAQWWTRIMQQNNLWPKDYDYWRFRQDLTEAI